MDETMNETSRNLVLYKNFMFSVLSENKVEKS